MDELDDIEQQKAIQQAMRLHRESADFRRAWPEAPVQQDAMPTFSWIQLERQLTDLAGSPEKAEIAAPLVSAMRKQAPWKPPEMVLREILCLAWTLMDESFQPGLGPGEEGEMP